MKVNIPVSLGELLDKISILEIKSKKISNDSKLTNIKKELNGLKKVLEDLKKGRTLKPGERAMKGAADMAVNSPEKVSNYI